MPADFSMNLGAELRTTLAIAAAHCRQTRTQFVRDACAKALAELRQSDPALAVHLDAVSRQAKTAAK